MSKHRTVKIGIIGTGQIGTVHLENYEKIPGVELVAACDVDEGQLKLTSERFKIPHTYTKFRELLQRDDIEAVDICLHNNFHAPIAIAAFEAGKDVFCEKPMAGTYVDAKAMLEAARQYDRKLSIQLGLLFKSETKVAKRLIDEGKLEKSTMPVQVDSGARAVPMWMAMVHSLSCKWRWLPVEPYSIWAYTIFRKCSIYWANRPWNASVENCIKKWVWTRNDRKSADLMSRNWDWASHIMKAD